MIKPQDKGFANLLQQRYRDLPLEPRPRIVNLAAVAVGGCAARACNSGRL